VSIDIVMQIKAESWMNAGNKYGFRKRWSKGTVLKVTVTLLLLSMSDVEMDAMKENGAEVSSFIGRGRSLYINSITILCWERSGYFKSGGGIVMTGICSHPMSMRICGTGGRQVLL
jgi:hypothetical protein